MPRRSTPSCLWSYPSAFPGKGLWGARFTVLVSIWTHKAPVRLLSPLPANWIGGRRGVRESREPAPLMGRVSFVQTARGGPLFPMGLPAYQLIAGFVPLKGY